jgi:hypothetical protein
MAKTIFKLSRPASHAYDQQLKLPSLHYCQLSLGPLVLDKPGWSWGIVYGLGHVWRVKKDMHACLGPYPNAQSRVPQISRAVYTWCAGACLWHLCVSLGLHV